MKKILSSFIIFLTISISHSYAGGMKDFMRGFADTTVATQERHRCEDTYSPAMCAQMEADKQQKAVQEQQQQQMQLELQQQREEIQRLKQQQQNQNQNQ